MAAPFFVVSTGRSGTMSLALALNQHPLLCVMHEPYRDMIQQAYWQLRATGEELRGLRLGMVSWLRNELPRPAAQRVGIVDQKLAQFIQEGHEAFPNAQWLWLVRDGRDVVASGYSRGWYSKVEGRSPPHDWARWRLRGDVAADVSEAAWAEMDAFERNCWYWGWMQRQIGEGLTRIGDPGRLWRQVRLEDLVDLPLLRDLQAWLGVEVLPLQMLQVNASPEGKARSWATWGPELRTAFDVWCGREMDEAYPGWREGWAAPGAGGS